MDLPELVAAERARTAAQIADLTAAFDDVVESAESAANDDEHDPDGSGGVAFERAQVAALLREARAKLADLDRAADRLAAGTYGVCAVCGAPIPAERLAARPSAETCVRCAT